MTVTTTYYELVDGSIVKEKPLGQYKGIWRQMPSDSRFDTGKLCWYYQPYSFYSVNDNPIIPVNDNDLPKALELWVWLKGE